MLDELTIAQSGSEIIEYYRTMEDKALEEQFNFMIILLMLLEKNVSKKEYTKESIRLSSEYGIYTKNKIKNAIKKTESLLPKEVIKTAKISLENDYKLTYSKHDIEKPEFGQSDALSKSLKSDYIKAINEIKNLTKDTPDIAIRNSLAMALEVKKYYGNIRIENLVYDMIKKIANQGMHGTFGLGTAYLSADVKKIVQTTINRSSGNVTLKAAVKNGFDYVIVSGHRGARYHPTRKTWSHIDWQADIYKIDGKDSYADNLEKVTGFPSDPGGLLGWNCRHSFAPHKKGDENPYKEYTNEDYSNQYQLYAKQRQMERSIRITRSKVSMLESMKKQNFADTSHYLAIEKKRLSYQVSRYKDFSNSNKLQISNKNIR
jgi:hypothetical protein